ncbi:MAG: amidohydrolase family protein [Treponema sp.]|jgi:guanine deaminase|nr:amidohydrolase family protein [Treponema sp.]
MNAQNFILKGGICYCNAGGAFKTVEGGLLVCTGGRSSGVYSAGELPEKYRAFPVRDYSGKLVIPGLVDLHMHAPQYAFRGMGMDLELLEWLNTRAFPEEAKYADSGYARSAYSTLVRDLRKGPNTRVLLFSTVHVPASLLLMDLLEESGLVTLVGKVNMDRNCPEYLREHDAAASLEATEKWLGAAAKAGYKNTGAILTPRFIPSCSDDLMRGLAVLRKKYGFPLQSHLSENRRECQWVRELCPGSPGYAGAYAQWDLLERSVMAHCVYSDDDEIRLLAGEGVFVAHCPQSNTNLSSGIAPVRRLLDSGVHTGLGSDVAGGAHVSIFRAMTDAIQVSKLRHMLFAPGEAPLSMEEAFYLGTAGGGAFFGSGSFEDGCELDALVMDDSDLAAPFPLSLRDRLERVIYLSDDRNITAKYVRGTLIMENTQELCLS